jgi:hypothetical protein
MKRDDSAICPNYRDPIEARYRSGEISKNKRGRLLNDFWNNYLPEKSTACILQNRSMWATVHEHDELVCVGCGLKLSELGVTDPVDYNGMLVDLMRLSIPGWVP